MLKTLFGRKMNNRGSALLTVVLVVGFLTILATTLLYVSGMNFQIKQADYQNKKSFYTGETALEEIRAHLMEDVSKAAAGAYGNMTMKFVTMEDADVRQVEFNHDFVERLQEVWDAKLATVGDDWQQLLVQYYTGGDPSNPDNMRWTDANSNTKAESSEVLEVHELEGYIRIKGIRIVYTNPDNGRTTIIATDMDVYAPNLDWSAMSTSKTLASGVGAEDAAARKTVDVSKCVRYANWKKE